MAGQLAEVGHQVRLVHRVVRCFRDHRQLHDFPGENSTLGNLGLVPELDPDLQLDVFSLRIGQKGYPVPIM